MSSHPTQLAASTLLAALSASLLLAFGAQAAAPSQVSYQGLLLDDLGMPVQGNVAMLFDLYDALSGGGLLWSEAHPSVPVLDGVYDVVRGSSTPLTAAIVAGGSAFLEVTVNGETLTPRQQFSSVPYALHAETASSASVASTALEVAGTPGDFYLEMVASFPFDGGDPPNSDPREGTADTDGDGVANFLDSDNDGDGLLDSAELLLGSDINVTTPDCCVLDPALAEASITTTVNVSGANFDPAMTLVFGSQSPVPQSLTATSFSVDVGPQAAGSAAVSGTLPNGQSNGSSFSFVANQPVITSLSPTESIDVDTVLATINGSGFAPGISVAFGSESPAPMNITPSSLQVQVGPQPAGVVNVVLSYPSGNQDSSSFEFVATRLVFVTGPTYQGSIGLIGGDIICTGRAAVAGLPGSYLAWMNDGVTNPATQLTDARYSLVGTGTKVADSIADLTDGSLDAPINRDEFGALRTTPVWTGALADGSSSGSHCQGFTSNSTGHSGTAGTTTSTGSQWTNNATANCSTGAALYCFQR